MKLFNFLQPSSANVGEKIRPHFSGFVFNLVSGLTVGLLVGVIVLAFNNPTSNPTSGDGIIGVGSGAPASSLYINSTGNVGIGTAGPATKLQVIGAIRAGSASYGLEIGNFVSADAGIRNLFGSGSHLLIDSDNSRFRSQDGTVSYMEIKSTGNVGIGNVNPAYKLDVNGNVNATAYYGSGANLTGIPGGIPSSKVYDSGWFAVTSNTTYTKTHNLGTTKIIPMVYFSQTADNSGTVAGGILSYVANYTSGTSMVVLTTTSIGIRTSTYIVNQLDASGNSLYYQSGYARIVMLALE